MTAWLTIGVRESNIGGHVAHSGVSCYEPSQLLQALAVLRPPGQADLRGPTPVCKACSEIAALSGVGCARSFGASL